MSGRPLLAELGVLLAVVASVWGLVLFVLAPAEEAELGTQWQHQLSSMADDRRAAIEEWMEQRAARAQLVATFPATRSLTSAPGATPTGRRLAPSDHLEDVLSTVGRSTRTSCWVLSMDRVLGSCRGDAPPAIVQQVVAEVSSSRRPIVRFSGPERQVMVSFGAPVPSGESGEPAGVVVLSEPARDFLWPLLTRFPFDTDTAETTLVEVRDGEAVFLNAPRHSTGSSYPLRRPLDAGGNDAFVAALRGDDDVGLFRDYRGVEVYAAVRKVAAGRLGLVVKVDRSEVHRAAAAKTRLAGLSITGVALAVTAFGLGIGRRRRERERRQALQEVGQSESRLREALEAASLGTWDCEVATGRVAWSGGAEALLGFPPGSFAGTYAAFMARVHPEDRPGLVAAEAGAHTSGGRYQHEFRVVSPDGSVRWLAARGRVTSDSQGRAQRIQGIVADITERRRHEDEVRRLYRAIEQSPVSVIITDAAGDIEYVNGHFSVVTGYTRDEVIGRNPRLLKSGRQSPEFYAALWATLGAGREWRGRLNNRRKDGTLFWEEAVISPVTTDAGAITHYIAVKQDITAMLEQQESLQRSEARLLRAQRMEAVGRLAGGVAHDFNNLLGVVIGYAEILLRRFGPADPDRARLHEVLRAAERGVGLTRQLLAFSRQQPSRPRVVPLNDVIHGVERLLSRLIGEDVDLALRLASDENVVEVDPGQMEQVLMNLAVNARDAMPAGGRLTIETRAVDVGPADTSRHGMEITPGRYVRLSVSDTGQGMDAATQARIFEPFFTTKEEGKGTGLGLATVYGIVKQSRGYVWLYSEPGHGTTFHVYLPLAAGEPAELSEAAPRPAPTGGAETILVVEDQEQARELVREILESLGYRVLTAGDGSAALELAAAHPDPIHLLLTDVVLPRLSGRELAEQLTARREGLRVLYMSGYTADVITTHGVLHPAVNFIEKPFTPTLLAQRIRDALDGREGVTG